MQSDTSNGRRRRCKPAAAVMRDAPWPVDVDTLQADTQTRSEFEKDGEDLQM